MSLLRSKGESSERRGKNTILTNAVSVHCLLFYILKLIKDYTRLVQLKEGLLVFLDPVPYLAVWCSQRENKLFKPIYD